MVNNVPIQWVHKSHTATLKRCSEQLYLKDIIKLQPEFVNESAVCGSAFHRFTEEIYKSKDEGKWDKPKYWIEFFIAEFEKQKELYLSEDINFNTAEDIKAEDYAEMIIEYLQQPWNRYAEPVLIEAPFRFTITRGKGKAKKVYGFEGRIDQLLKIQWKYLPEHFQRQLNSLYPDGLDTFNHNKPYIYIHRDIKTGTRKSRSEIELATDDNIMFYSYALAMGLFDLKGDGNYTTNIHHVPFAHALYYTRDHLRYKRAVPKSGKVAGDYRGQGMYFIRKTLQDLVYMEEELIKLWHRVNYGPYTRDGASSNLCENYCPFKKMCLHDFMNPVTQEYKLNLQ